MSDQALSRDIAAPPIATHRRHLTRRHLGISALAAAVLLAGGAYGYRWWTVGRFVETTDDAYVGTNVTPIAPHIAGFVQQILVRDNQHVHAGQTLIRLDPQDFQAALQHAEAVLQAREAALANLVAKRVLQHSVIAGADADLAAKQAQAAFTAEDAARYHTLALTAAGSRQSAEKSLAADRAAHAAVRAAQAAQQAAVQQVAVLDTEIAAAKADVAQAQADVHTARLNLGYTAIT
ncbi:MAG TPA: biotin/lipoyl-binding protein, partial [Acetobacteraceae bacterium]|nr:biotin/lipoyl-binding protein [Acetobacteraceae bacterium]